MGVCTGRNGYKGMCRLPVCEGIFLFTLIPTVEAAPGKTIEEEPSWIVVTVLFCFLLISILVEYSMEYIEHKLKQSKGLSSVLRKVKDELMLMGFISLVLVAIEDQLVSICIPVDAMVGVPCFFDPSSKVYNSTLDVGKHQCEDGYTSFLDVSAIHHIHILIFI